MSQFSLTLGAPPASWTSESLFCVHSGISECITRTLEPVGRHFFAHARRKLNNHSFTEDERLQAEAEPERTEEAALEDSEEETEDLLCRDPKDWKEQDHYAVLGLAKLRWQATEEQIKLAHRKKVLKHHPDKKASSGNTNDDAFFKCIQKAHEILSDPVKRRQYDSVDMEIDDSPPSVKTKGDFFKIYRPVFEREARFSNKTPVPLLGDMNTKKEDLEAFYDFWYNFDSWRTFEYLDKEDADSTDNRDDKRYIERKNKSERAKRKKEDNTRLRKIVDQALSLDPRIQKYKQEEKAMKEAKKKEKEEAAKRAEAAAKKAAEEEQKKKEEAEAEAKQKQLEEKKEKAARKKAIRNERKVVKNFIKEQNYFHHDGQIPPVEVIDIQLSELDILLENLNVEELQQLKNQLTNAKDRLEAKQALIKETSRLVSAGIVGADAIKYFIPDNEDRSTRNANEKENQKSIPVQKESVEQRAWTSEEISLLIKAVNKFPGGTVNRWETISEYVADHSSLPARTNEELIKKSNDVKKGAIALDEEAVRKLQHRKKHTDTRITEDPSIREATINYDDPIPKGKQKPVATTEAPVQISTSNEKITSFDGDNTVLGGQNSSPQIGDISKNTNISASLPTSTENTSLKETTSTVGEKIASQTSIIEASSKPTTSVSAAGWTSGQQAQLERALQAYPKNWKGSGDRWDMITAAVEGKTKKEVKTRVKYLSERAKAKAAEGK